MQKENKKRIGHLAIFATTFIWGTSFVILKNTLDSISVLWILAFRFSLAALIMFLVSLKDLRKLDRGYLKGGVLMGLMLFLSYVFQTYGLNYTTPGKNAFLTSIYVILVPFLYWIFSRKAPGKYNIIAALLSVIGVGLVSLDSSGGINIGDILTIICGLFFGLHMIATDFATEGRSTTILTFLQLLTVAVLSWIAALICEPFPTSIPNNAWFSIIYLSVMCTAACFFLQTFGQKHSSPSAAAIIMALESVFGTLLSIMFYEGEKLTFRIVAGFAIIFISILISETKLQFLKRKPKNDS